MTGCRAVLVLALVACACRECPASTSKRWHSSAEGQAPLTTLRMLLKSFHPAAAFDPSSGRAAFPAGDAILSSWRRINLERRCTLAGVRLMSPSDDTLTFPELDGKEVRIGIVKARGFEEAGEELVAGIKAALEECGVQANQTIESEVPDTFNLPLAAQVLAISGEVDVVLPVGVVMQSDVVTKSVARGLMQTSLSTGMPVIYGLYMARNEQEATDLSGKKSIGQRLGKSAVEMALLRQSAVGIAKQFFFDFSGKSQDDASTPQKVTQNPSERPLKI
mmetsp:Transcript_137891/g.239713  ORF Transcript_137891/g.239713 Transcript_137891/m.239713 type:complete len:277 (-) Transcript_137891:70-900(-)